MIFKSIIQSKAAIGKELKKKTQKYVNQEFSMKLNYVSSIKALEKVFNIQNIESSTYT